MNFYKKNIQIKLYFFAFGIFIILISYVFADIITDLIIIIEILNNDNEMINLGNIYDIENGGSSNIINNTIPTSSENFIPTENNFIVSNLGDGATDDIIRPEQGNSTPTENQLPNDFGNNNNNDAFNGLGGNDPEAEATLIIGPL
jgi:hypothetical protein